MKKRQRGFTLIETVMATAVSSIIIIGLFTIFQTGNEQVQLSQVKMTLEDSMREGLHKMTQEIRQSAPSRITIGVGGNSLSFQVPDPTVSLVDANFAVNWTAAHTIRYALGGANNRQLIRTDTTTNAAAVIANDITSSDPALPALQFTGNGATPTIVTITIRAQRTLISGRVVPVTPLSMTAQAEVRNP